MGIVNDVGVYVNEKVKSVLEDRSATSQEVVDACDIMFLFGENWRFNEFIERDVIQMAHDRLILVRGDEDWVAEDDFDNLDLVNEWIADIDKILKDWTVE